MTPAALEGIAQFGLGWRFLLRLSDQASRLGDEELALGDAENIANEIGRRVKVFVDDNPKLGEHAIDSFTDHAEDLSMIDDDLDEIRHALRRLYDDCDFYRVLVS